MAEQKTEAKKRSPRSGRRITVTLSDEHYEQVTKAAAVDDRQPNVFLSRIVRKHLDTIIREPKA